MTETLFEQVANFRDFGGWRGDGGRRVLRGKLYRSGHHARATETDLTRLAALDFAVIVDLRRTGERARGPARRPTGCRAAILEHGAPQDELLAPHLAFLRNPEATFERVLTDMADGYRKYPFDPFNQTVYRDYFARLAQADGPILIQCHAGKDRTGALCALTLSALGVARPDIFEDYLATNRGDLAQQSHNEAASASAGPIMPTMTEPVRRLMVSAEPTWLEAAFDSIETRYGGVDAYLEREIGVTPARRDAIRARLLA